MGGFMSTKAEPTNYATPKPTPPRVPEATRSTRNPVSASSNPPNAGPPSPRVRQENDGSAASISYTIGDVRVCINFPINPWKILGLNSASFSRGNVKLAFRKMIVDPQLQNEALVSLANHILTSTAPRYQRQQGTDLYTIRNSDHFTVAAYGDINELENMITRNESLIEAADEHDRTVLYLACKSGFDDIVEMLLEKGAKIDSIQKDGSTPLHAAAYFGHPLVVEILLVWGARTDIQNAWGQTAFQESATTEISSMIENPSRDPIFFLTREMIEMKLVSYGSVIKYKGKVIAKELIRDPQACQNVLKCAKLPECIKDWKLTWHGTRFKNLQSILKHGLLPAGTDGIKPPSGHFSLGREYMGVENWAAAIFVSPSIWYSADSAYAEKVISQDEEWCVLIKAYCKPDSYERHDSTIFSYVKMAGEPIHSEYRVPAALDKKDDETVILRVESERNVVVRSVVFIRASVLQDASIGFDEMTNLFKN